MKTIQGYLRRLGESTVDMATETKKYSLIEVGDQVISSVKVSRKLANFVSDGVGQDVTLYMQGATIVACTVDGRTYYEGSITIPSRNGLAMVLTIAALPIGFWTVGLIWGAIFGLSGYASLSGVIGAVVAALLVQRWGKKFSTPKELSEWKAQGATAV